jgi:hypothetical protein
MCNTKLGQNKFQDEDNIKGYRIWRGEKTTWKTMLELEGNRSTGLGLIVSELGCIAVN